MVSLAVFRLVVFLLAVPGQAMSQESKFGPGYGPGLAPSQGELILPDDHSFTQVCMSHFADAAKRLGWRFGNSILTRSSEWGLVWRVDFELASVPAGGELGLVTRVVCWRKAEPEGVGSVPDGTRVAFGQLIDRLK